MLPVAVNPRNVISLDLTSVQGNHGFQDDYSLGNAGQVYGSTVLLSNPLKKVAISDNASCGR